MRILEWQKTVIIFDPKLNTPVKFQLSIIKGEDKYRVRVDVLYYSWGKKEANIFQIKNLTLHVVNNEYSANDVLVSRSIIEPNFLFSNVSNFGIEKFIWHRVFEFSDNINLRKNSFDLELRWEVLFPNRKNKCCLRFKTLIPSAS